MTARHDLHVSGCHVASGRQQVHFKNNTADLGNKQRHQQQYFCFQKGKAIGQPTFWNEK